MKNSNATANALRIKIPRVVWTGYMSWWMENAMYTHRNEDRMYFDSFSNDSYNVLDLLLHTGISAFVTGGGVNTVGGGA